MKKLYVVTIMAEVVVIAGDEHEALRGAEDALITGDVSVEPERAEEMTALPGNWDVDSIPARARVAPVGRMKGGYTVWEALGGERRFHDPHAAAQDFLRRWDRRGNESNAEERKPDIVWGPCPSGIAESMIESANAKPAIMVHAIDGDVEVSPKEGIEFKIVTALTEEFYVYGYLKERPKKPKP